MDVVSRLRDAAIVVFADQPVLFAYLFGSHARGSADRYSDVDVAAYFDYTIEPEAHLAASLRLAGALERETGVGPVPGLVVLNEAPLPLAGRVVREGKLIYSVDEPRRVRYESRIFREFTDFDLQARKLDEDLLRAHAEGRR